MARLARVVVPGVAHHVTQRGNRRRPTFFQEEDYGSTSGRAGTGTCGRDVSPPSRWTSAICAGPPGTWSSIRSGPICRVPWRWRWSSAAAHVAGRDDAVVRVAPLLERVKDWRAYLLEPLEAAEEQLWRRHECTGRPLGEPAFLDRVERILGRSVRPAKRGRKPKSQEK
jgi:putative transposase